MKSRIAASLALAGLSLAVAPSVTFAGAHTWDVVEVFSNPCGNIQFIEIREMQGTPGETGINNGTITSNTRTYDIPNPALVAPTTNKRVLFATPDFAALPGAPTPNYIFPASMVPFFNPAGDTIRYTPYDTWVVTSVPTDGVNSLNRNVVPAVQANSPTNYAGTTGSVNATPTPPAVPDGNGASAPVMVRHFPSPLGPDIEVSWDTDTCCGPPAHHIVYGGVTQFPSPGQPLFGVEGAICGVGATSPFVWPSPPEPADGSRILWFLVLAGDGSGREGSWGLDAFNQERRGPGTNGSSGFCSVADKNLDNACGN